MPKYTVAEYSVSFGISLLYRSDNFVFESAYSALAFSTSLALTL